MSTFYEGEYGEMRFTDEELDFPLNDDNFFVNLHRDSPQEDRIAVEDPRDQDWWNWWRLDTDPEVFDWVVEKAREIGTVMLRGFPMDLVSQHFDLAHQLSEEDMNMLLGEKDGSL